MRGRFLLLKYWGVAASLVFALQSQDRTSEVPSLIQHAVQLQQSGDFAGAEAAYRQVLKITPDDVATHVNLGVVLVNLRKFDDAIAEYEAADRLLPGDSRIKLNIALAYEKSGRLQPAMQRFEELHRAAPQDNRLTMLLADGYLQLGQDDQVIQLLEPLESQTSDDLGLAYMLGTALLRKQRIEEGQRLLDRILRNGDSPEARFLLGTRMFESGDYPAAVKQLASAAELNSNLPQLQSLYGQALLNTGDPDAAATAFRKELATNPNDYRSNLALGQILAVRRQCEEATPLLQRAIELRPESGAAELSIAGCVSAAGDFAAARPYAEAAAKALPDSFDAHRVLAKVYTGLHRSGDAERERRRAQLLEESSDPGPKLNDLAPGFELVEVGSGREISLTNFRGKTPVVLVFGSYSCPNFRGSADALKSLYQRYGARVPFLLIYIREAHSIDQWQSTRHDGEKVELAPAATLTEKQDHAAMCSRKLHLPFPAVVDGMDGRVEKAYNAWPSRVFVIGENSRVLYNRRLSELDFQPEEMEAALRRSLQRSF